MEKKKSKPVIMMVDDEPDFLKIIGNWVSPYYEFVGLTNGDDLTELVADYEPELLILDVRMPGKNGFELCKEIRAQESFSEMPILFFTACKEDADFIDAMDAGCTAHLTKPVNRRAFMSLVKQLAPIENKALI